jgi:hypothetical protein
MLATLVGEPAHYPNCVRYTLLHAAHPVGEQALAWHTLSAALPSSASAHPVGDKAPSCLEARGERERERDTDTSPSPSLSRGSSVGGGWRGLPSKPRASPSLSRGEGSPLHPKGSMAGLVRVIDSWNRSGPFRVAAPRSVADLVRLPQGCHGRFGQCLQVGADQGPLPAAARATDWLCVTYCGRDLP